MESNDGYCKHRVKIATVTSLEFAGGIVFCPCCENLWGVLGIGLKPGEHEKLCHACAPKEEINSESIERFEDEGGAITQTMVKSNRLGSLTE